MERTNLDLKQLRNWCLTALVFWSVLMNGSLCLFAKNEWQSVKFIGSEIGLAAIHKDNVYEIWNARYGGVYVFASDDHSSNTYLSKNDVFTEDGKKLTLINPARMTRQVYEIEQAMYGIQGHITSLDALRPENNPDEWEKKALLQFEQGAKEVVELMNPFIRVMAPTIMQKSCLKCHIESEHKPGEIRGGISVTLPIERIVAIFKRNFKSSLLYHFLIYLIGITGLAVFYFHTL
ncbi:MAG: DUF3365 domain-containing protein [Candidatus Electrothrix sp. AR3]|nr:DUF3365 domain-containing protein [Candidatus Electrothrix sp. AR3]